MSVRYSFTEHFQNKVQQTLSSKYNIKSKKEQDITDEIKAPVDLFYHDENGRDYLIELEIHRADPSNNIAKIAYWLDKEQTKRNVTVIQFFSPHYKLETKTSAKMEVSIYLGDTLIKKEYRQKYLYITLDRYTPERFETVYKEFPQDRNPSRQAKRSMKRMAEQIAYKIYEIITS